LKAKLKVDHYANNHYLYDKAGAEVTIRFKHDNVWIVQNDKGNMYPIHKDKLCQQKSNETN